MYICIHIYTYPTEGSGHLVLAFRVPSLAARYLEKKTRRFFDLSRAPPFLFPRVHPRLTRWWIKTGAPDKKIGLIKTFSWVYPKKGEHAPGKYKNRRFHAKSANFLFKVSCSQLRNSCPRLRTRPGARSCIYLSFYPSIYLQVRAYISIYLFIFRSTYISAYVCTYVCMYAHTCT